MGVGLGHHSRPTILHLSQTLLPDPGSVHHSRYQHGLEAWGVQSRIGTYLVPKAWGIYHRSEKEWGITRFQRTPLRELVIGFSLKILTKGSLIVVSRWLYFD